MKKFKNLLIIIIIAIIPVQLSAASYSAGANAWYAWIEPSFKDQLMGKNDDTSHNNNFNMTEEAALIYGALFGIQFTDNLSLGAVFSYGTGWKCEADYIYFNGTTDLHMYKTMDKMERTEGDLTLNYRLNNIFKLFFGWKYYGQRGEGTYNAYTLSDILVASGTFDVKADSNGPGAGVTVKLNLDDNLYFISSLSGIYMKNKTETTSKGYTNSTTKTDHYSTGPNAIVNFIFVVPDSAVSLSLGGRYQYLVNLDDHSKNKLYGVMLTAIYSFGL